MPPEGQTTQLAQFNDDDFKGLMAQSSFMPYIRLFTGKSEQVMKDLIPANHWGLVRGKEITDLGDSVDVYPLSWRPRAMKLDPLEIRYNSGTDRFKALLAESEVKNSGVMAGPEFLLYVPKVKEYVTYHACGFNSKEDAKKLFVLLKNGSPVNIGKKVATQGKFTNVVPDSKPTQSIGDKPSDEEIQKTVAAFLSTPDKEPEQEAAPVAEGERAR